MHHHTNLKPTYDQKWGLFFFGMRRKQWQSIQIWLYAFRFEIVFTTSRFLKNVRRSNITILQPDKFLDQGCDLTKVTWKIMIMGSGPGSAFGLEDKAPWTSWMFNFGGFTVLPYTDVCVALHTQCFPSVCEKTSQATSQDLQTLHIPTNKKLEVCKQCRLLSLMATSLLSWNVWGKGRFVRNPEILRNHRPVR